MNNKKQKFFARVGMLALVAFLALPLTAFAQNNGRGRGKPTDVFVNGHDARDGRWDKDGQRRGNDNYGRNDQYDRNRRGRNWDRYGAFGGSFQLRQTALNAGYNEGVRAGRNDRRNGRFNPQGHSAFRNASKDYNSRYGNPYVYQQYFRQAFINGYSDGYNYGY